MQWKGMCEWDMFERRLLNAIKEAPTDEIERASIAAADSFLKLYGADKVEPAVADDGKGNKRSASTKKPRRKAANNAT